MSKRSPKHLKNFNDEANYFTSKYPLVYIVWEDIWSRDRWASMSDIQEDRERKLAMNIGWVIEDGEYVKLASCVALDEAHRVEPVIGSVYCIPRSNIKEMKYLTKPNPKKYRQLRDKYKLA